MERAPHIRLVDPEAPAREETPLEAAFRANARLVHSIATRILGSREDADDLLQDLFIAAMRDLRQLEHPGAVRQWFVTAAVRLSRRRLHRRRFFSLFGGDHHAHTRAVARDATPEQRALLTALYRVLDRIGTAERIAWTLRHVEGMQLEEVAAACGCSLATAKRRIAVAHALIEEAFHDD